MRILTLSTIALVSALGAGVASANSGIDQLAASVGVSANGFTQAQLIQLKIAQRDNDQQRIDFILSQVRGSNVSVSNKGDVAISQDAQLAANAGVAPGLYTANELQRLIVAKRNNNDEAVNYILSGASREGGEAAGTVSPGKAQLAGALGLNPNDYTLSELVTLSGDGFES